MSTAVIEIEGLRKEYHRRKGRSVAVEHLDLVVPAGGVYGFLGPNGSGKTTTIRCLLGLVRATSGHMNLFGRPVPACLPDTLRRVGAIVEAPALFPTMTARENLGLLAAVDRIPGRRVEAILEEVGLGQHADQPVRRYSLGMRQRLALGAALLKDPELLVLDEPANGLDPAGIRQVRELLRRLGREGRTVFVSSHLLSEVEQVCDSVAILHRGRCVLAGAVSAVLASAARSRLIVKVDDVVAGRASLLRAGLVAEHADGGLLVEATSDAAADVTRVLAADGLWVTELRREERTLEELFLEITAGQGAGSTELARDPDLEEVVGWAS